MPNASKKGFVLTVTLIFLVVVLIIVIAFLDMIRVHLTSTTYRANREKGVYLAEAGSEQKLLQLKLDLINSASNIYDAFNETWAQGIGDTNGSLNDSEGISLGSGKYQVLKGFIDGATPPDTFQNLSDEQGKININYANQLLLSNLFRLTNASLTQAQADSKATAIINYKYGGPAGSMPGVTGVDDDRDGRAYLTSNSIDDDGILGSDNPSEERLGIEFDGMDNDDDGTIDETNEGIDEPDEFRLSQPYGDDNPFDNIEELKKASGITETDYNNVKNFITVHSLINANSLYANEKTGLVNFPSSTGYKIPYALAPRITRSAVPRAPVNLNTASLIVLTAVLWDGTTAGAGVTRTVADSVARSIIDYRNGADNIHSTSDDNPFDSIGEFESFVDTRPGLTAAQKSTIKDNANPSPSNAGLCDYDYGYNSYTTEFFFFFTDETNEDIIDGYDCNKGKFYFTSKAFLIKSSGEILGTGGSKAKPELTVAVER